MFKNNLSIKISIAFLFFCFIPLIIKATIIDFSEVFSKETFEDIINTILDFVFWVGIAIFPFMILVGGFYFLTSGGDPQKISTAKKLIFWAFIGLIIVLLAKGLPGIIETLLE
jgi:magnesium-transporting ATPase (P-type)